MCVCERERERKERRRQRLQAAENHYVVGREGVESGEMAGRSVGRSLPPGEDELSCSKRSPFSDLSESSCFHERVSKDQLISLFVRRGTFNY